jgi:hypothetical protein
MYGKRGDRTMRTLEESLAEVLVNVDVAGGTRTSLCAPAEWGKGRT